MRATSAAGGARRGLRAALLGAAAVLLLACAARAEYCSEAAALEDTDLTSSLFFAVYGTSRRPAPPPAPSRRQRPDSAWPVRADGDLARLQALLKADPCAARSRAADGRDPLFWAYEFGFKEMIDLLQAEGADADSTDSAGKRPADLLPASGFQQLPPPPAQDMYAGVLPEELEYEDDEDDFFDDDTEEAHTEL